MAQKTFISEILTASDVNLYLAGEGGAWSSFTPEVTQLGSVAVTNTRSRFARYGRTIVASFNVLATGTGTAANGVTVSLPATAAAAGVIAGVGSLFDASSSTRYPFQIYLNSTTVAQLWTTASNGASVALGSAVFTAALAAGDIINATFTYEAAA